MSGAESGGAADRARLLLFVDDTLAEHLEEEMRSAPNVVRFLFTRARRTRRWPTPCTPKTSRSHASVGERREWHLVCRVV